MAPRPALVSWAIAAGLLLLRALVATRRPSSANLYGVSQRWWLKPAAAGLRQRPWPESFRIRTRLDALLLPPALPQQQSLQQPRQFRKAGKKIIESQKLPRVSQSQKTYLFYPLSLLVDRNV